MTTLAELQRECDNYGTFTPEYHKKMIHQVPDARVLDRVKFLTIACTGRNVLSLGATGPMQTIINGVAKTSYGIDIQSATEAGWTGRSSNYVQADLDKYPLSIGTFRLNDIDLVIMGEVLEHMANPGAVLKFVRSAYGRCDKVITVPNAFGAAGIAWMNKGIEMVNIDHVAYYSYWTMKQLLDRCDYEMEDFFWYNGQPYTAEGMIFVVR